MMRSETESKSNDYVITVPKAFTNKQENICLTWLNKKTLPKGEQLKVAIRELQTDKILDEQSIDIDSGTCASMQFIETS